MKYSNPYFRSQLSEDVFNNKYRHDGSETWPDLCVTLAKQVVQPYFPEYWKELAEVMTKMQFIPGGRYLYYAGRPVKFFNNCYLLKAESDTREDWADISWKSESCLLTGGGIGIDYSIYRDSTKTISRTGGKASGPIPKMLMVNEIGRRIMQGGSRRSAIYASLNWKHGDVHKFLETKNWHKEIIPGTDKTLRDVKNLDFNFPAPLDMTNISVNYDTEWLMNYYKTGDTGEVFKKNVQQALETGEPGFSFNFFDKENETLRNA
jgi:ribonucleoside-diphosphate reductase alpha chain